MVDCLRKFSLASFLYRAQAQALQLKACQIMYPYQFVYPYLSYIFGLIFSVCGRIFKEKEEYDGFS